MITRKAQRIESTATEWVTIIESITTTGQRLTPFVIFTGKELQAQWFPEEIKPWGYSCTSSGWSNSDIALRWLRGIYLPETKPARKSDWRILILDQHTTHISMDFIYEYKINHVQPLYLPPHSSQKTQPLDVGVYSPLKTAFHQEMRGFASFLASAPI